MPEMVLTISSIGLVMPVSISVTLAPRSVVVTVTTGRSTLGNRSTPSRRYDASPSTNGAETSITVKIGRRTQSSQILGTRDSSIEGSGFRVQGSGGRRQEAGGGRQRDS